MKHIKHLLAALLLFCSSVVSARDFQFGSIYYNILSSNTVEVTSAPYLSDGYSGHIIIPESITYNGTTYSVTAIGYSAFDDCTGLTSITIPSSVTAIKDFAFEDCTSLRDVYISDIAAWCNITFGADYTHAHPFMNAKNLYLNGTRITDLIIPEGVTEIKSCAFMNCRNLTSVTIPSSVTTIGMFAFKNCTGLTDVYISDLTAWCNIMFEDYEHNFGGYDFSSNPLVYSKRLSLNGNIITELVIPEGVTKIKGHTFRGCSSITSVTIPSCVTTIGEAAFWDCSGLTGVYISDLAAWCNIDFIFPEYDYDYVGQTNPLINAKKLYLNGTLISDLVIPEGVEEVKDFAFSGCSSLKSVTIPNCVKKIGLGAFDGCSELADVYISDLTAWCNIMFEPGWAYAWNNETKSSDILKNAKGLYLNGVLITDLVVPEEVTEIKQCAFFGYTNLASVTIHNNITSIGKYAFEGCSGLTSVIIGKNVTSIEVNAFYACEKLKTIINLSELSISKGSTNNGNVAYYADKVVNIPGGELIDDFIFAKVNGVSTLVLYLGEDEEVVLPDNYKGEPYVIGVNAFNGCTDITNITIPNSVTDIGDYAFEGCTGLTSIEIPESVVTIGNYAFSGCTALEGIEIPNSVTAIGNYAFDGCTGLTRIEIPNSVITIGERVFQNCSGLVNVAIGNSVTAIGNYAFSGCSGLTDIIIPNSVTTIGNKTFYGCNNLKTVINFSELAFSKGSTNNGYVAYYANKVYNAPNGEIVDDFVFGIIDNKSVLAGCLGEDEEVTLPDNYKGEPYAIGANAFEDYTNLKSITLPNNLTAIGNYAFDGCTGLTNITIPNSVTAIGDYAFNGCTGLTRIEIPNSVITIGERVFQNCSGLVNVAIGNSVTAIGVRAFYGCTGLTSIELPNSITAIGNYAFSSCI